METDSTFSSDSVTKGNAPRTFPTMVMSDEDYETRFWPQLQAAVQQLLVLKSGEYTAISFEQVYSCVYKCVCSRYSEKLFNDLRNCIRSYLYMICQQLREVQSTDFITAFEERLSQYRRSLQQITIVFTYMNRFYVEIKLQTTLLSVLLAEFTSIVAEPYIHHLIGLLNAAQSSPFTVSPATMASTINGLYDLKPDYCQLAPSLFAKYIPNILPPMNEADIPSHIQEIRYCQNKLAEEGYSRGCSRLKRSLEIETNQ